MNISNKFKYILCYKCLCSSLYFLSGEIFLNYFDYMVYLSNISFKTKHVPIRIIENFSSQIRCSPLRNFQSD